MALYDVHEKFNASLWITRKTLTEHSIGGTDVSSVTYYGCVYKTVEREQGDELCPVWGLNLQSVLNARSTFVLWFRYFEFIFSKQITVDKKSGDHQQQTANYFIFHLHQPVPVGYEATRLHPVICSKLSLVILISSDMIYYKYTWASRSYFIGNA